jgi:histidinol phosphatase-like enzyme
VEITSKICNNGIIFNVFFYFFETAKPQPLHQLMHTAHLQCINLAYMKLMQMMFVPALSREFRPYKPDPAPLLHICSTWKLTPNEVIMVGDSLKDDVSILHLNLKSSI